MTKDINATMQAEALQVNAGELIELLNTTIRAGLPVLIKGAPGIGKSDIVAQAAAEAGADLILSHPVVSDPLDFKGLPWAHNGGDEIVAEFIPFGDLKRLITADKPTVFFLDDLGQAPPAVQAACMQLILARQIDGHKVADCVTFVAATNRKADKAGVTGILEPVKSRFCSIVELIPDLDDWTQWAVNAGMPPELIAFIRFKPGMLNAFEPSPDITNTPCPRTVANIGRLMLADLPKPLEMAAFSGAAGAGFATEFLAFLKIARSLPDPDSVLADPDRADVPHEPATLYALSGSLAARVNTKNAGAFFRYAERLTAEGFREFAIIMYRDGIGYFPELVKTKEGISFLFNNQDFMLRTARPAA